MLCNQALSIIGAEKLNDKIQWTALLALMSALQPCCAHAEMVKCVQADGKTVYQSTPCPVGASSKTIAEPVFVAAQKVSMTPDSAGHFHAHLSINDVEVEGLIDTGAPRVTMSAATAKSMSISSKGAKLVPARPGSGNVPTYNTMVNMLKIGGIALYNVDIAVVENSPTVIGMSALSRFKITQENGQMILEKR